MHCPSKIDLHSGLPFWLVRNGLLGDYPQLLHDLDNQEIVIIGAGISGALAAHELCSAGYQCTMLDRRLLSSGSTWASTAQLNYEIDTGMTDLAKTYGEEAAVGIYQSSLHSVKRVGELLTEIGVDASYESKPSLYLASDRKGKREIKKEYELRQKHSMPVELLDKEALKERFNIERRGALYHPAAAQLDAYRAAAGIINHHVATGALRVYTRTTVTKLQPQNGGGILLQTGEGHKVHARYVVCAPGYESETFLPKKVMDIHSTYALVTQPIRKDAIWKDAALIWESARPYFYMRTTPDNRIMMGGGDEPFKNEKKRDALLDKKEKLLLNKCYELYPHLEGIMADFAWCGSFGETDDGLPYIGEYPGMKGVFFALGYGGNGTTFSMIAAEVVRNTLQGKKDERLKWFGFRRK